ncbi:helix-turn-helix domain-containing protein [Micromonospora sp. CA-259024]|uniref:helix-turn-helix domain-containing protein n=1 Tax=Micromonospora sp. CA-259024 TaxID=3239965 RepID=UPI003D8A60A2
MGDRLLESLVRQAIRTIRERYEEPLSLDDLARTATMSKFHFLRTFRNVTGVTPIRFLSAVRIDEAKHLLFATSMTVAEISVQVGYGSLGTFTRRFTECVGLPPTTYRRVSRGMAEHETESGRPWRAGHQLGALSGTVQAAGDVASPIFIGVFETNIPQGRPVVSTTITEPGAWRLPAVPAGSWHLLVAATPADEPVDREPAGHRLLVATADDVRVMPGAQVHLDVTLRPLDWIRPPLMVALPGVEALRAA